MAKASKPGNVAVSGITSASTKAPTLTQSGKTASATGTSGSATTTKINTSTSTKSSSSTGKSSSSAYTTPSASEPAIPYSQQFYAALAAGIPSGLNADEYIAQDKAANATKAVMANAQANVPYTNIAPIDYVDISQQKAELKARQNLE